MTSLSFTPPLIALTSLPCKSKFKVSRQSSSSVSCKANDDSSSPQPPPSSLPKLDRRNVVLLGLGGLYGAGAAAAATPVLTGAPIQPPDLSKCKHPPDALPHGVVTECCPPFSPDIVEYRPQPPLRPRVRPAAHKASPAYVAKYEKALALMKALPDSDPRSFKQQANIHCAYCNGAYNQVGSSVEDLDIQVHFNWLFFPFHRWYLYFYERILGKLVGDPDFAIPYWNWDAPPGMQMPAMFTANPRSPLYDTERSKAHQPPYVVDLDYDYKNPSSNVVKPDDEQIRENLATMYRQMVSGAKVPGLFFGAEYRTGNGPENSPGTIENTPHTQIHVLSGSEANPNGEDMGNFYSAGRDPMFYAHHGNVDRMWCIWKTIGGGKRRDPDDPDWLDAGFLFYDENARLVSVKVRDCIDTRKLGYTYEPVDIPWLSKRPNPKRRKGKKKSTAALPLVIGKAFAAENNRIKLSDFPITLKDSPVSVEVPRPKPGRKAAEDEEEVLVVEGINFDRQVAVKFDVYVDDEDEGAAATKPDKTEYAGTFANVPHQIKKGGSGPPPKVALRLGISELLEDVGAEDDDAVIVTLKPRTEDPISIDNIKIVLLS